MYTIVWRFTVRPDRIDDFVRHYGPDGSWAKLFRSGEGYIGTELHRSVAEPNVYVTIDRWESQAAYDAFRQSRVADYQTMDAQFESLTIDEEHLGTRAATFG
jgi:quinol monooxygenase YgiN